MPRSPSLSVDRRRFLALSGAGLTLAVAPVGALAAGDTPSTDSLTQPFLSIDTDGVVTVFAKHLDMGQGIWSGLASIIAEELDADWSMVRVEGAPAKLPDYGHTVWGAQTTGGSTSIANSWDQLREAGAIARRMLVEEAAERWSLDPEIITVRDSVLSAGGRSATFGELAAAAGMRNVPGAVPKTRDQYRLLGREDLRQLDMVAKSTGQQRYAVDGGWPDLKTVMLVRPPSPGATLRGYDAEEARASSGVLAVVETPAGIAVVAESTWQAMQARAKVIAEWDRPEVVGGNSAEFMVMMKALPESVEPDFQSEEGSPADAFASADTVIEAEFEFPYLAHAQMEPLCALGRLDGGQCFLRGAFQSQTINQQAVADILGLSTDDVFLETIAAGGSFGRRAAVDSDWVVDVAHVLGATGGRWPIKIMRTREEDMAAYHYRPQVLHRMRAALSGGQPVAMEMHSVGAGVFHQIADTLPEVNRSSVMLGNPVEQYDFPATRLAWWNPPLDIPIETYRGISNNHTALAKEIFIDRLSRAADVDPVEFRLSLLGSDPRKATVLRKAAQMIGWDKPLPEGRTRGVAVHLADESRVCQIVEVSGTVDDYRIERVVCAVDVGFALNPDVLRAQVEGGIGFALSNALHSEVTLEDAQPVQNNYDRYRVLRMADMPRRIDIEIIDSDEKPTGIGEPGSVLAGAALINALERMGAPLARAFPYQPS